METVKFIKDNDSPTTDRVASQPLNDLLCCDICGGRMVSIRGRYPKTPDRIVCPTCMAETLDSIKNRLSGDYGRACKAT